LISRSKTDYTLDASALLALMLDESGGEQVRAILDRAYIHSVNVAEVVGKLVREGVPRAEAELTIEELKLDIDEELPARQAALSGELVAHTRQQGLSLGDCVCLTVAASHGSIVVTADRKWQELNGQRIGSHEIRVQVIR
jgi:PIN domain nuclease of toxin-antitoxin system